MRWNIGLVRDERGNGLVTCSVAWRHVRSRKETAKKWQKFIRLRQLISGAIALLFLSTSYAASPNTDVVHLSGTETITGWKTDTNNFTFSDPNTTLLLGGTSVPDLHSTIPGLR